MITKAFHFLLMATLAVGLSLNVTACSDDDDANANEQPSELADPLDTEEARVAWRWLNILTNVETMTSNWASKTYEPTFGQASEHNALTRIVIVSDLDEARQQFANLADVEADELQGEKTISQRGVGTMTWTPSPAGAQNLAEVSVNIGIIPSLQKIVFCTQEQVGENGIFWTNVDGTAWYRFGDVVRDKQGYYWVCVRPSFKQKDKGDSHWINIVNASYSGMLNGEKVGLPKENIYDKYNDLEKYGHQTIILPTKLKYSREHIHNLSNLLWALLAPANYEQLTKASDKGLGGFKYDYHSRLFVERVARFWSRDYSGRTLWERLFNCTYDKLESLSQTEFIYKDYSWWFGNEATFWIYKSEGYEVKIHGSESGDKEDIDVVNDGFDINHFLGDPDAEKKPYDQSVLKERRWVVRYKTGEQLCENGKYSPYTAINGCTEIYRYNALTKADPHGELETENMLKGAVDPAEPDRNIANNAPKEGEAGTYLPGDVVKDEYGNRWFCILGAPHSKLVPSITDNEATFVSFDFNDLKPYAKTIPGLPTEEELPELAYRLGYSLNGVLMQLMGEYQMDGKPNGPLGLVAQHILDYAGVNMRYLQTSRDSVWHFYDNDNKQFYDSPSIPKFFSIAYDDGSGQNIALARVIYDLTQAGDNRDACHALSEDGKLVAYKDMRFRLYKHYETYDPSRIKIDYESNSLKMTKWNMLWPMTNEKMTIGDIGNADMIARHAADDKWVTLPLYKIAGRQQPRTVVDEDTDPRNFLLFGGQRPPKTNMFNEPVLVLRTMRVTDRGGKTPNLVSTDGRQLQVVHLQDDENLYNGSQQGLWVISGSENRKDFYIDNQLSPLPAIPGSIF